MHRLPRYPLPHGGIAAPAWPREAPVLSQPRRTARPIPAADGVQESGASLPQSKLDIYTTFNRVLTALKEHDVGPAIRYAPWARSACGSEVKAVVGGRRAW